MVKRALDACQLIGIGTGNAIWNRWGILWNTSKVTYNNNKLSVVEKKWVNVRVSRNVLSDLEKI